MKKPNNPSKSGILLLSALACLLSYYGAYNLIENGGGKNTGLTHDFLDMTIVDHLLLGVIVFYLLALFSLVLFILLLTKRKHYKWILISEGLLLILWTAIQLLILNYPAIPLHSIFTICGILFIFGGLLGNRPLLKEG